MNFIIFKNECGSPMVHFPMMPMYQAEFETSCILCVFVRFKFIRFTKELMFSLWLVWLY